MILKTIENSKSIIISGKDRVEINSDSKDKYNNKTKYNGKDERGGIEVNSSEIGDNEVIKERNYQKMPKFKKTIRPSDFFILGARLVFTKLKQAFVKALILHYFKLEYHI